MNALFLLACCLPGMGEGEGDAPLQVREPIIERGEVKAGMPLTQTFHLRNAGKATIVIADARGGCGCARSSISRKELKPGESAELVVEVNTLTQPVGPNRWPTTVRYRHGDQPEQLLEVQIKAMVVREIEVKPIALALIIDREARETITITDRRDRSLQIKECRSSTDMIEATKRDAQNVALRIRDALPPGKHQETVTIVTDDPDYRELRVPITVFKKAPGQLVATPERIDLRLAKDQDAASALVRLRDPDDKPIVVERIETDHPALRGKWAAGPGNLVTLRLSVELDGPRAPAQATATVYIKEPKPQTIVVPVSWKE